MALPERWRPIRELDRLRGEMDDLLEHLGFDGEWLGRFPFSREVLPESEHGPARPAIETRVEDGEFIVRTDLPGVDPKDVEVKVVGGLLTIRGSREEKRENKKAELFRREIRYGSFERSIALPGGIKAEDLKATFHNGVLELVAPMPKEAVAKAVKIQVEGTKS